MVEKIDKARKTVALWAEDVKRLQELSQETGRTQVELAHDAIVALEQRLIAEKER